MAKIRGWIQLIVFLITNSYLVGFIKGKIYTGELKKVCVPGMNCYSCPGALGSCPIGSLQAVISGRNYNFSYYVVGFLIFTGALISRLVCGFLCPFGWMQDLLNKIKFPVKIKTFKLDKYLRYFKYLVLIVFVILLPMYLVDFSGLGSPYFCKWICPVGTLEAGIPLVLGNEGLQNAIGMLYVYKNIILIITVILSIIIYRPFCKYICPLGAIYAMFNNISVFKLNLDKGKCINCNKCNKECPMQVKVTEKINSNECIRCMKCMHGCPVKAITYSNSMKADK